MEFNLTEEAWIRVRDAQCRVTELPLPEALMNAHRYKALAGESPAQDAAILRLLIAVAYTVFYRTNEQGQASELEDEDEALDRWEAIWNLGQLPAEPIRIYFEKWRGRFDLLDEERPFYQVPEAKIGTPHTAAKLNGVILQSENKQRIFSSRTETSSGTLSCAEAARWLVYLQGYDDASVKPKTEEGKRNVKTKPGSARGWLGNLGLLYAVGDNLFETVWLNTIFLRDGGELYGKPEPCWELSHPRAGEYTRIPMAEDLAGLFSLQGRRVLLKRDGDNVVAYSEYCGDLLEQQDAFAEPMTVWKPLRKKNEIIGYLPRPQSPGRQLWRDFSAVAVQSSENRLPGIVYWLEMLQDKGCLEPDCFFRFAAVSALYDSSGSSVINTISDSLSFHADLLGKAGQDWQTRIVDQIHFTEKLADALGLLAGELAVAAGKRETENKKLIPPQKMSVAETAKALFYFRVDGAFRQWLLLPKAGQGIDEKKALHEQWRETARNITISQGRELAEQAGEAAFLGRWVKPDGEKTIHYSSAEAFNRFLRSVQNA